MGVRQKLARSLVKISSQCIQIQTCFKAIWNYVETKISGFPQRVITGNYSLKITRAFRRAVVRKFAIAQSFLCIWKIIEQKK